MSWIEYKMTYDMVLQTSKIRVSENVQYIRQSFKLHRESHEKLEGGIDSEIKKNILEVKFQRGIFLENSLWSLQFVMILFNPTLKKMQRESTKLQEKYISPYVHGWYKKQTFNKNN